MDRPRVCGHRDAEQHFRPVELWCHAAGDLQQRRPPHERQHPVGGRGFVLTQDAEPALPCPAPALNLYLNLLVSPQKESFYQQKGRLAAPSSQKLACLINTCLSYEPMERPSFLAVLRRLTEIKPIGGFSLHHHLHLFFFMFSDVSELAAALKYGAFNNSAGLPRILGNLESPGNPGK